jgi:hypothetical protein
MSFRGASLLANPESGNNKDYWVEPDSGSQRVRCFRNDRALIKTKPGFEISKPGLQT